MDMSYSARPPIGRRMKARAPPPPSAPQPAPRKIFRNAIPDGGAALDTKENVAQSTVDLQITLPNGYGTLVSVDGRKALMDVLVDLCAQYHLNPAEHTLELASTEGQPISFKPNALLGTLHASRALIKERTPEERVPRKPAPKVPEKTVRLVVNYHRGQKAVVRVNPLIPLQSLVPTICQKCELNPARVLLLRDAISQHELDLCKSLTELDIRELYVLDQTLVLQPKMVSAPVLNYSAESLNSNTSASGGEKKGLLGLFSFNRRKSKTEEFSDDMDQDDGRLMQNTHTNISGLSAVSGVCVEARPNTLGQSQSAMNLSRLSPKMEPKKRRAPAPPHPSAPTLMQTQTQSSPAPVAQTKPSSPSQLKKRKAPLPPPTVHPTTSSPALAVAAAQVPSATAASEDSMSDLSHSIEDSEPAASTCSSSSSDDAAESSSLAEEAMAEPAIELTSKVEPVPEPNQQPARRSFVKREPEETESALELKMEEVENSRQSAIVWQHTVEQEAETVSMCSSESLADQGYAASEGMADSPSTSPEDTASLGPDPSLSPTQPQEDCDSDEGCATWGSRHSSGNMRPRDLSVKRNDGYEEDTEITAQIQLTLADLDADLADEVNRSYEESVCLDNEIPVSVVDMDVPVTAIDEVIDDKPTSLSADEATLLRSSQNEQGGSNKEIVDLQNKNNNARMSKKASISPSQADQIQSDDKKEQTENVTISPGIKGKVEPDKQKLPETSQSPAKSTVTRSTQNVPESRLWPPPTVQSHRKENTEVNRASSVKAQNMISQNPVSRFGLKTITIVPTKPVGSQNHVMSEGSLRIGAIKIDELGNMVTQRETQDKSDRLDEASDDRDSPLLDKAKAFWSSAKKEDSAPTAYKRASIRTGDVEKPLENPKPLPVTVTSQPTEKSSVMEPPKQVSGPSTNLASAVMKKLAVSDPAENIFFSEHRKNLNFLKPSRRTSSHYVASAITKYTGNSSSKVDGFQELPESTSAGQKQLTSQGFKNDLRPVQAVSNHKASNASANSVPVLPRTKPYPSYTAEKQEISREPQIIGTDISSTKALNSSPVNSKPQQQAQISTCSELTPSSSKEYMSMKKAPGHPMPLNSTINTTRPAVAKKPELHSLGLQPSPFGPVKKFKPVVPKSVEKETSLHSSLMEAIQSGEGMERLRKVSDSSKTSTLKKPSYVEPENERSALLSAIRAESTSARLKKTSSSAAVELEQFRKSEENRANQRHTSPSTTPVFAPPQPPPTFTPPPPPPTFTPPPPPPTFTTPPPPTFTPPPPPPLSLTKPTVVLPAGGNPESAREALLEAIRSGAGAQRLRKVPVSAKTVKVNGRLGIIRASASPPQKP
ncbi:protein cordon-bleu isoform X4 [Pangasianodon hypophthalmus]|uniref:protein cordon-bleu isoform X4 n=1 Tax=Pangasianodon hypophthalmus TaxID=310915 RepID=UPI00230755DA|nr:protein cordon-bleu isoform X4 [Pangasianodon hypophthalmus]